MTIVYTYRYISATPPKKGLKKSDFNITPMDGLKKSDSYITPMEGLKNNLEKLTKEQLIEILLDYEKDKITKPKNYRQLTIEDAFQKRRSSTRVQQMAKDYEDKLPIPPPRNKKYTAVKPVTILPQKRDRPPKPTRRPPPIPEVKSSQPKITQLRKALKGSTKSFTVEVISNENPLHQLNETKNSVKRCLIK